MSCIVMTTIGSLGDLHPKIAIALELRQRGHEIVFATHQEYQDRIEALGFEFRRMRPDNTALNDPEEMARMMDLKTGTEYVIGYWLLASLRETYEDLLNTAKNADLIISGEGVVIARLVAEKLDIPWVFTILQPMAFMSSYDPPVIPLFPYLAKLRKFGFVFNRGIIRLSKIISKPWVEPIDRFKKELGLPPLPGHPLFDCKYSPYLVLALFSTALAKPQPD